MVVVVVVVVVVGVGVSGVLFDPFVAFGMVLCVGDSVLFFSQKSHLLE